MIVLGSLIIMQIFFFRIIEIYFSKDYFVFPPEISFRFINIISVCVCVCAYTFLFNFFNEILIHCCFPDIISFYQTTISYNRNIISKEWNSYNKGVRSFACHQNAPYFWLHLIIFTYKKEFRKFWFAVTDFVFFFHQGYAKIYRKKSLFSLIFPYVQARTII